MAELRPAPTSDLLSQLAPAHAPPPAGWWPPAPGWWLLAVLLICAVALPLLGRRRRLARLQRITLSELKQLERDTADDAQLASRLEHLLRRFAVARHGRAEVAGLTGQRWIDFIVAHGGSPLSGKAGTDLLQVAYGGSGTTARALWLAGARGFIRSRR
jgi:hypothetical protein